MRARLSRHELVEVARPQIQVVFRSDDTNAEVAERQLASAVQVARVVEAHGVASVHERHPSRADDFTPLAAHHERRILIDSHTEQLSVRRDDEKESLQSPTLGEVRVDDGVVAEQAEAGPEVLLDEIPFLIDFAAGHGQLRECGGAGARPADDATLLVFLVDRARRLGPAERRNQFHLVTTSEEDTIGSRDALRYAPIGGDVWTVEDRDLDAGGAGRPEPRLPFLAGGFGFRAGGGESDDSPLAASVDELDERPERMAVR
jgi:hypothetical protein